MFSAYILIGFWTKFAMNVWASFWVRSASVADCFLRLPPVVSVASCCFLLSPLPHLNLVIVITILRFRARHEFFENRGFHHPNILKNLRTKRPCPKTWRFSTCYRNQYTYAGKFSTTWVRWKSNKIKRKPWSGKSRSTGFGSRLQLPKVLHGYQ